MEKWYWRIDGKSKDCSSLIECISWRISQVPRDIFTHVFYINLGENCMLKARIVAGGHKKNAPSSITYILVVPQYSVRICLLIAALNSLDIQSAYIKNSYLTAPCQEKIWTRSGNEFRQDEGRVFTIEMILYDLKSSGSAFRAFLTEWLDNM